MFLTGMNRSIYNIIDNFIQHVSSHVLDIEIFGIIAFEYYIFIVFYKIKSKILPCCIRLKTVYVFVD